MLPINTYTHAVHSQFRISIYSSVQESYFYTVEVNSTPITELKTLTSYMDCVISASAFIEGYVAAQSVAQQAPIAKKNPKSLIHVNQHVIKDNKKTGAANPPLTAKTYKENNYASEIEVKGNSKIIYSPDKPLSCGATVWIETHGEVVIIR